MERKFTITVEGRRYDVTVEELTEGTSYFLPQPGDMHVPSPAPPAASGRASQVDPPAVAPSPETRSDGPVDDGDLPSPLAGVVVSVAVVEGDRIEKGQALLAIDAMKMQTSIVASTPGTVAQVYVKPGEAVEGGQALLRVE